MKTVNFTDFRKHASNLISEVENGQTLIILRHGQAIAEVRPTSDSETRLPSWKRPRLKLTCKGADLSSAILDERRQ